MKKGAVRIKSVFNYDSVRWLEKHHRQKKVSRQILDEEHIKQLREMFDHLDEDDSGTIEVRELELAMKFLGIDNGQEKILEQFEYMDADNSGSIDFEEFVTVMTSDLVDQEFFQLQDEKEAAKWDLAFFQFATNFQRQKLIDEISGKMQGSSKSDRVRYAKFETLFQVPVLPNTLSNDQAAQRLQREANRRKSVRVRELDRCKAASKVTRRHWRANYLKPEYGSKFLHGKKPPFMSFDSPCMVPRDALGTFEQGEWKRDITDHRSELGSTIAWDLLKNRKVRHDGVVKQHAIREAKSILGTQNEYVLALQTKLTTSSYEQGKKPNAPRGKKHRQSPRRLLQ